MLESELSLDYFRREGFKRYRCKKCGSYFWSTKPRDTCTESPCGEYRFIGKKGYFRREFEVEDMRREFIEFFKKRGHTPVERYPVAARWRDDVFLVNASIYDFQPHVTSGLVPPPANPLVISQPCIRMVDVDSVGRTGRHLTGFEMMAHHAFNYSDKFVYWKDETVAYAIEFLEHLGVEREDIVLKEHPWFGGGNAGASFEVIVGGLELATLVFMNLRESENGDIEIEGTRYEEMPVKIVDTGYGLERFVWVSKGTPTIYDAVYPEMVKKLMDLTGVSKGDEEERVLGLLAYHSPKIEEMGERAFMEEFLKVANIDMEYYQSRIVPIQKIYALADYSRSLSFMLTDGIIPSNIQAGYLARLLIRRSLNILNFFSNPISLYELVEMHVNRFSDIMDTSMLPTIREILEIEEERYRRTLAKGRDIVKRMLKKKNRLSTEDLVLLYDSHGLLPEVVKEVAGDDALDIPENFHSLVAQRHEKKKREKKKREMKYEHPDTRTLYYEDPYLREFTAKVIHSDGNRVILDSTAFYPEGGGQPADHGKLIFQDEEFAVVDVQKYGGVIVHILEESVSIPTGVEVRGVLDWERRERLMRMHTAEHVLLAACRKVLGRHVWQHGTQKDVYESRFDIAHYKPISRDEVKRIEEEAMRIITSNVEVEARFMNRREAEDKYGFVLYEGGIPPGREIRVVRIDGYDVEACGGTHVHRTGEIGFLKILGTERIQDGVSRIFFSAGISAIEKVQEIEDRGLEAARVLGTSIENLPEKVTGVMDEWKRLRKEIERMKGERVKFIAEGLLGRAVNGRLAALIDISRGEMQMLMRELSRTLDEVVLINGEGMLMVHSSSGNARKIAEKIASSTGGRAGGRPEFAQGKVPAGRIDEGINIAKTLMGIE